MHISKLSLYFLVLCFLSNTYTYSLSSSDIQSFFSAIQIGDTQKVTQLLSKMDDKDYVTIYHGFRIARQDEGHTEIIKLLLPRIKEDDIDHAFFWEAGDGHIEMVSLLLPKASEKIIQESLRHAIEKGQLAVIKLLLDHIKNSDFIPDYTFWNLCTAAKNGHTDTVAFFLSKYKYENHDFKSAIDKAAENGHIEIVKLLLPQTRHAYQALSNAVMHGHTAIIDLLLSEKSDCIDQFLVEAVSWHEDKKVTEILFTKAKNVDAALVEAAENSSMENVILLLPKAQNIDKALERAIYRKHTEIIELLLPKIQKIDDVLEAASRMGYINIVTSLLPKAKNIDNALRIAIGNKHKEIIELLLPKVQDIDDALNTAIYYDSADVIGILLSQINDIDKAIVILDHIKSNKKDLYLAVCNNQNCKGIIFINLFSNQDWVTRLLWEKNNDSLEKTQTGQLFSKYIAKYPGSLKKFSENMGDKNISTLIGHYPLLAAFVNQIVQIELNDEQNGYVTFMHGRNWEWNYLNDVWNIICALRENKDQIPTTISMRQREENCDINQLYRARKKLVKEGITGDHLTSCTNDDQKDENDSERSEVTFLTYTGIAHLGYWGECSMRYVLQNHSASGGSSGYEFAVQLIKKYGLEQYQKEFDELYQLHKSASDKGELLCISIAKDKVDDIVYPAQAGGYKAGTDATSQVITDCNKKINDPNEHYMQCSKIFCAAALNIPNEGEEVCKIRSVTLADNEKYKKYKNQRQKLFEELKLRKK